jgi:putative membrane protein
MTRSFLLAGSVLAVLSFGSLAARADSPREFLTQVQQGANSEIMLGQLAAERGRSPGVREFGQTLVTDHRQTREEVRSLGYRFDLRPTREMTPEALAERDRLMAMRGRSFDREFIRYMIDDHQNDIAEFRNEAREGHGAVSELARRQLPVLRKHLDMAMALDNRSGRFSGNYVGAGDSSDWRDRDNRPSPDNRPLTDWRDRNPDNPASSDWRGRNSDNGEYRPGR